MSRVQIPPGPFLKMRLSDRIDEIKRDEKLSRTYGRISLALSIVTGATAGAGLLLEYFGENTFHETLGFFSNGLLSGYLYSSSRLWRDYGNHLRRNYPAYFENQDL